MIAPSEQGKIKKILLISLSNLGDVIMTTPVISAVKDHFPAGHLTVLVGPRSKALFDSCRTVDCVIIRDKQAAWTQKLRFAFEVKRMRYDLVIDLRNTAIPFWARPKYRSPWFSKSATLSMRERHLSRIKPLIPVTSDENRFDFFSEEEAKTASDALARNGLRTNTDPFTVVSPGARSSIKRWPVSQFAQVVHALREMGRTVVMLGDENEIAIGHELEEKVCGPLVNLIGKLTVRQAASVISHAALVVANDSAIMHLGYELNRPVVAIFGPTDESKYGREGPRFQNVRLRLDCTPCEQAQCIMLKRFCLDDLDADRVIEACRRVLDEKAD